MFITATGTKFSKPWKPCIKQTVDVVNINNDILVYNGQGDGDTKWNGWFWKLLFDWYTLVISYYLSFH